MATLADVALAGVLPETRAPARLARAQQRLAQAGNVLHKATARIYASDVLVDLGDCVGSGRWWRGVATLVALTGAVITLGAKIPPLVGPIPIASMHLPTDEVPGAAIASLAEGSSTGRQMAPTRLVERLAETPERPRIGLTARMGAGGLDASLRRAGVGAEDLRQIRSLWAKSSRGVSIKSGTDLNLILGRRETRSDPRPLESLSFRPAFDWKVEISRADSGDLRMNRIPIRVDHTPLRITGQAGASLDRSLRAAGLPASVVAEYRRQLGYVLDLQRDVGRNARFDVVIAHRRAETGETEIGQLLYAGLAGGGSNVALARWGKSREFYRENGESVRQGLMRSPLAGASRQSSGFGMRFHPVLGYSRMHKGADFAASTGTPILASASGRVTIAGRSGGYGNLVEIDHGKGLRTRYAHMHKIGVKKGQMVGQGDTLGTVGSTGLATGPHLHYEVWQNGVAANPKDAKFSGGTRLGGKDLRNFQSELRRLTQVVEVDSVRG